MARDRLIYDLHLIPFLLLTNKHTQPHTHLLDVPRQQHEHHPLHSHDDEHIHHAVLFIAEIGEAHAKGVAVRAPESVRPKLEEAPAFLVTHANVECKVV